MKLTTFTKTSLCLFIAAALTIAGCKKDNDNNNNNNSDDSNAADLSSSSTTADGSYDDVFTVAVQTGYDNNIAYNASTPSGQTGVNGISDGTTVYGGSPGYTVTPSDPGTFPKTVVVDFGTGITSSLGITRKGKITMVFSGKLITPGTTVTSTFTDYYVNGYKLEGTYTITNTSPQTLIPISFTTSTSQGKITYPDSTWYTYSGNKSVVQTGGSSTPVNFSDDVYKITGTNVFASSAGNTLQDSITTPLVKANSCTHIGSGIISFVFNNTLHGTLDYGNGDCDSLAVIKVGSVNVTVGLK